MEPITDVISESEELEVPPTSDLIPPTDIMLPMTETEPLRRSSHLRTPTRRLIEEINSTLDCCNAPLRGEECSVLITDYYDPVLLLCCCIIMHMRVVINNKSSALTVC